MLKTYYNTTENIFFNEMGDLWRDYTPELTIRGRETINLILVSESSDYGTAAADPESWARDTDWREIAGISAVLTIDSDFQHRLKGSVSASISAGVTSAALTIPGLTDYAEIPAAGIVTFYSNFGAMESVSYNAREVSGNIVTFSLDTAISGNYSAGTTADVKQSPLAMAYLNADKSDWDAGSLVFDVAVDSARLRSMTLYSDNSRVNIAGVEFLLYRVDENNSTIILRRLLWDTPTLVKPMGDPGFPAPLPEAQTDYIAAEVDRQVAADVRNPIEFQFSADGVTDWHETQTAEDRFYRQRIANLDAAWSDAVMMAAGVPGKDGHTPERGVDYWTDADKAEIKAYVDEAILNGEW